jgi:hypothetical protein
MKKKIFSILTGISIAYSSALGGWQELNQNDFPSTLETRSMEHSFLDKRFEERNIHAGTIANSIFLYEGPRESSVRNDQNPISVFYKNLEKEVGDMSSIDKYDTMTGTLQTPQKMPLEQEATRAAFDTFVELNSLARKANKAIKDLRDKTTVNVDGDGFKLRTGAFVNKIDDWGQMGIFVKAKGGRVSLVSYFCLDQIENSFKIKNDRFEYSIGQDFKFGERTENITYISLSGFF